MWTWSLLFEILYMNVKLHEELYEKKLKDIIS